MTGNRTQELDRLLADFDVPAMRRDLTSPSNVRWLLRNLAVRNKAHPRFGEAITLLRGLARGKKAAPTGDGSSVGLFIPLPPELASQYEVKEEDPSPPHVTLLFVGPVPTRRAKELVEIVERFVAHRPAPLAVLNGTDAFVQDDGTSVVWSRVHFSSDLKQVRDLIWKELDGAGFNVQHSFQSFHPHATIEYRDKADPVWDGDVPVGSAVCDRIEVWGFPEKHTIKFAPVRTASTPAKYEHIDFTPPKSVADAAAKGLEYRRKASPSNRGGLTTEEAGKEGIGSGVQRATNLKNRDPVSPEVIRQMSAFFARHEKNKDIAAEHKDEPWSDKGHVAWLLWGGDPGKTWVAKIIKQMEATDKKESDKEAAGRRVASAVRVAARWKDYTISSRRASLNIKGTVRRINAKRENAARLRDLWDRGF